ncbi:MAG: GAF domain-containing protein [Chloroflexia bacterium]
MKMTSVQAELLALRQLGTPTDDQVWPDALRREGAARAHAGASVPNLIGEALARMNGVEAELQTQALAALVSGYFEGQEKRADEQRLALEELSALFQINSAANSTLDYDEMLDRVVGHVAEVMRTAVCSLFIYEPEIDRLVLRASRGLAPDAVGRVRLRLGEGVTGWAGRSGKPLALRDGWSDKRFQHIPELGEENTHAILAVPIVFFTKLKLVGVITLQSPDQREFTERDVSFLETVAGELAIAIENARLHRDTDERLRQKVTELTILQGVSASIAATLNLQEVASLLASEATHLLNADAAVLYELRDSRLVPTASFGLDDTRLPSLDPEISRIGRAIIAGQPLGVEVHSGEASHDHSGRQVASPAGMVLAGVGMDSVTPLWVTGDADGLPFATQLCVPLLAPRSIVGGICIYSKAARRFSEEQISLLLAFAREGAIAIENAYLYDETRRGLEMQTLLLREMHHRVRNNLQRAASLLRMQANRLPDDNAARHALQESVIRIQSIARVHDLLSRRQVGLTDVAAVAGLACEVVSNTLGRPDLRVHWYVESPQIVLSSQQAFPLTLLLTEMLSNSVLHGFAGRDEGRVQILAAVADDRLELVVTDNGVGLPEGFDPERDAHLGLEVIHRLGEQELGGRVAIFPNPDGMGARSTASVPYQPPTGPDPTEADRVPASGGNL